MLKIYDSSPTISSTRLILLYRLFFHSELSAYAMSDSKIKYKFILTTDKGDSRA